MKNTQSKNNKSILEQMYDRILEKGGPTGPITQSIIDAWEKPIKTNKDNKKIIISYVKKGGSNGKNN